MKTTVRILSTAAIFAATPALAQSDVAQPAPDSAEPLITVLGTGSPQRVDQSGQPISVITADQIERIQGIDIARILATVPGLTISRNGGPGGFTGVRVRGAESEQTLVLVDGVRVEDVSGPSGGFDFGTITTGGIDRIDVLRGSNSVVWGSAAIGGVVAITSKETNGVEARGEAGSRNTYNGDLVAGLKRDRYALSFNGGYAHTDGVSSAATGTEPDGFRQWRVGGKGRFNLTDELALVAVARYADSKVDIDGYPAPFYAFTDTPEYQTTRQIFARAGFQYTGTAFSLAGGYALSDTKRDYYDPTFGTDPSYGYRGRSERAELTGRIKLPQNFALDFGADNERTRFTSTFDTEHKATLNSAHALLGWYGDMASIAGGVRYDDHSRFGHAWTFGANGSVKVMDGLRLRASYGEGFKAPTLFQLLSDDYGNTNLVPERSRSYDAGIEYTSSQGAFHIAATVFRRDSRQLIAYVSCASLNVCATRPFGTYDNIGKARAEGVELEMDAKLSPNFAARAAYTYDKARNITPGNFNEGNDLARRPRHTLTTSVDWTTPLANLALGADMRVRSASFDDAGNFTRLEAGSETDLRVSLPFGNFLEVFGRIENLFDARVQTAATYGVPGRSVYAGLRVRY